jgi:hypothetical protein
VRLLESRCPADRGGPSGLALAAAGGHNDILRVLLMRAGEAERNEALAFAVWNGRSECERLLAGSRFTWSVLVESMLNMLSTTALEKVALWFGRTGGIACGQYDEAVALCDGVRVMAVASGAPDSVLWTYLRKLGSRWIPDISAMDFELQKRLDGQIPLLRNLPYWRVRDEWQALALLAHARVLGPLREDLFAHVEGHHWHHLLKAGIELRWGGYSDGTEYLPVLSSLLFA